MTKTGAPFSPEGHAKLALSCVHKALIETIYSETFQFILHHDVTFNR